MTCYVVVIPTYRMVHTMVSVDQTGGLLHIPLTTAQDTESFRLQIAFLHSLTKQPLVTELHAANWAVLQRQLQEAVTGVSLESGIRRVVFCFLGHGCIRSKEGDNRGMYSIDEDDVPFDDILLYLCQILLATRPAFQCYVVFATCYGHMFCQEIASLLRLHAATEVHALATDDEPRVRYEYSVTVLDTQSHRTPTVGHVIGCSHPALEKWCKSFEMFVDTVDKDTQEYCFSDNCDRDGEPMDVD